MQTKPTMRLTDYLKGFEAATTADELEAAVQLWKGHPYTGPVWARICNARIKSGLAIVDHSEHSELVPRRVTRNRVMLCGKTFSLGNPGNGAGWRWAWAYFKEWARPLLRERGLSDQTITHVLDCWADYPHRALQAIERPSPREEVPSE